MPYNNDTGTAPRRAFRARNNRQPAARVVLAAIERLIAAGHQTPDFFALAKVFATEFVAYRVARAVSRLARSPQLDSASPDARALIPALAQQWAVHSDKWSGERGHGLQPEAQRVVTERIIAACLSVIASGKPLTANAVARAAGCGQGTASRRLKDPDFRAVLREKHPSIAQHLDAPRQPKDQPPPAGEDHAVLAADKGRGRDRLARSPARLYREATEAKIVAATMSVALAEGKIRLAEIARQAGVTERTVASTVTSARVRQHLLACPEVEPILAAYLAQREEKRLRRRRCQLAVKPNGEANRATWASVQADIQAGRFPAEDFFGPGFPASEVEATVGCWPGSPAKIALLARRYARREQLHSPRDWRPGFCDQLLALTDSQLSPEPLASHAATPN